MPLLTVEEAADRLLCTTGSLHTKSFRAALKLPAIKIGKRIGFEEQDIIDVIARRKERLPDMPSGEGQI